MALGFTTSASPSCSINFAMCNPLTPRAVYAIEGVAFMKATKSSVVFMAGSGASSATAIPITDSTRSVDERTCPFAASC